MNFYVTFGVQYANEPHPTLGYFRQLPNGWLRIEAESRDQARELAFAVLGPHYSMLYGSEEMEGEQGFRFRQYFPLGELGALTFNMPRPREEED